MLKELVEYLVGIGKAETPQFLPIPGRPELSIEVAGGEFGRLWQASESTTWSLLGFDGLRQFARSLGADPPSVIRVGVTPDGVKVSAAWRDAGAGWAKRVYADVPIVGSDELQTVLALRVAPQAVPVLLDTTGLVDLLRRRLGPGTVPRDQVDRFRVVDFQRLEGAKLTNERGVQAFGKSVEAKIQNVETLPEFVDFSIGLSPDLPSVRGTFRIFIDPRPASNGFALWVRPEDVTRAEDDLMAAAEALAIDAFDEGGGLVGDDQTWPAVQVVRGRFDDLRPEAPRLSRRS